MKMSSAPITDKDRELKYQTEEDARMLTKAFEIKKDPARLKRALVLVTEQEETATAAKIDIGQILRKLAGRKR